MKIKISQTIEIKQNIQNNPFPGGRFLGGQLLSIEHEDICRLKDGSWQFIYIDSPKNKSNQKSTYLFAIDEISDLIVDKSEFEELIKIDGIRELIEAEKIITPSPDINSNCFVLIQDHPDFAAKFLDIIATISE
ncbi:MAG: hypothetical protein HEQ29_01890 [Dolichospermum sp. LBC05a]|jgi:hypothetical protein|uniref:hypothetical protein n=1 Tax=Anabaena sp. AL09 TaxID=1710891 RepID=UPI0007FE31A8|nr:hypothetical protein [Anabaena sp. AL09]MBS9391958.1 hypothetical protein [Dolichospermum sp. OL01]MCO5795603.1 hypothetical protein [Dolichospermum sp. OL03]MCS6281409.1 hypothetical protein [Dolichospermum sp.]QSV57296.1 MAG: hypothetical protein HEQ29_01890 [Dolichospermum sp. LBC05a]OBQ12332.1 MAG: hypothetical protein AN490_04485 [Anabaena sp. AL09]